MKSFALIAAAATVVTAKINLDSRAVPLPHKLVEWRRAANGTNPNPSPVDGFELLGCYTGTAMTLAKTDAKMTIELCASSCSSNYFGVSVENCYCGPDLGPNAKQVSDNLCNAACPGNKLETCGGRNPLQKRQTGNAPQSVYRRAAATSSTAPTSSGTATGSATAAPTSPAGKIVCYGDFCCPELVCATCPKYRVICQDGHCFPEQCAAGQENSLVVCEGSACHYSQCSGDQCNRQISCTNGVCTVTEHVPCQPLVCRDGDANCKFEPCTGDNCNQKVTCTGANCNATPPTTGPAPPPVAPPAQAPPAQAPPAQTAPPAQVPSQPAVVPPPAASVPGGGVPSVAGKLETTMTLLAAVAGIYLAL